MGGGDWRGGPTWQSGPPAPRDTLLAAPQTPVLTWVETLMKEFSCWLMLVLVTPHNALFSLSSLFSLFKLKLRPFRPPATAPLSPLSCQQKKNISVWEASLTLLRLILRQPGVELLDLCDSSSIYRDVRLRFSVNLLPGEDLLYLWSGGWYTDTEWSRGTRPDAILLPAFRPWSLFNKCQPRPCPVPAPALRGREELRPWRANTGLRAGRN